MNHLLEEHASITKKPCRLSSCSRGILLLAAAIALSDIAQAQELAPRAYWPAPEGTEIVVLGYGYQAGDIVTDPSLPVVGVDSKINSGILAWQKTLGLFGRTSNLQLELPYASGSTRGDVEGLPIRRDVQGFGDLAATLSVNLQGVPSLGPEEFQSFRMNPRRIVAASIKVVAPTGQYDNDRIINIGTNRWAARLRLGVVQPMAPKWILELSVGTWFFQDNDDFALGKRQQKPIIAFDVSVIRRIRPGFWASLDATHYFGGRTTVDETIRADFQRNSRLGFSLAYPFKARHALKFSYSSGVTTKSGGDFSTLGITYIYRVR